MEEWEVGVLLEGGEEAVIRSKRPRRRTAIRVESLRDSTGSRIAILVFRRARPKV